MRRYGLIGQSLAHSFSKSYFNDKFEREGITDVSYQNFEIESIDMLPQLLMANPDLRGFNVTIPYKQSIIPYLSELDTQAAIAGAVNCIKIEPRGDIKGYNTDIYGFTTSLKEFLEDNDSRNIRALLLGSGGASKAVTVALENIGIDYLIVSREKLGPRMISYKDIDRQMMATYRLIVNTTPLGTFPNTEQSPDIPYNLLTDRHLLFDLTYNPPVSQFLSLGIKKRAKVCNGQRMLELQAERSWEIWNTKGGRY